MPAGDEGIRMTPEEIDQAAALLAECPPTQDFPLITRAHPDLTLDEAYAVQRRLADLLEAAGDPPVGWKVAMVDPARQRAIGATEPIIGRLFESGRLSDGDDIRRIAGEGAHVECEFAFVMGEDLRGPGITAEDVMDATAAIVPAFEIIERRSPPEAHLTDRIAANFSAVGFLLGTNDVDPRAVDRSATEVTFASDGRVVASGTLGGVLGDPALVVAWLVDRIARLGEQLHSGDFVLTGTIVPPVPASDARTFRGVYGGGLGTISLTGLGPARAG